MVAHLGLRTYVLLCEEIVNMFGEILWAWDQGYNHGC